MEEDRKGDASEWKDNIMLHPYLGHFIRYGSSLYSPSLHVSLSLPHRYARRNEES